MKCPRCWAEKAYLRQLAGFKRWMMAAMLLRPMKCHHCYHRFVVAWPLTWGKPLHPPAALRIHRVENELPATKASDTSTEPRRTIPIRRANNDGPPLRRAA